MPLVRIRAPITVFYDGAYRYPGTEIELEEVDARRLQEAHGTVDEEMTIGLADRASVDDLNKFHAINSEESNG